MSFPKRITKAYWLTHKRFPLPKVITFDAYNTLYCTLVPVMEQYSIEARKCGINVPAETLTSRFPGVFKALKEKHPNYGKYSGLTADQWWSTLIKDLFHGTNPSDTLVHNILKRFEGKQAYAVYPDVIQFLQLLKTQHPEIVVGIISNTDPNVYRLLENLGLLDYFQGHTYFSFELEVSKPDVKIFDGVLRDIMKTRPTLFPKGSTIADARQWCWHIGDEMKNDMLGAKNAGWNSVLIDRLNLHEYLNDRTASPKQISEHEISIQKVDQTMSKIWEFCKAKEDSIQLDNTTFVIPNISCFEHFFFE